MGMSLYYIILEALFIPIAIGLVILDFLITLVTFGWIGIITKPAKDAEVDKKLRSIPAEEGNESHRVHPSNIDVLLETPRDGLDNLYKVVMHGFDNFPNCKCMGTREYLGHWKGNKKIKHFGDGVTWRTYSEVNILFHKFGAALRSCRGQLIPASDVTNIEQVTVPCRIAIFENTCAEWMLAALGAFSQSITVATIYATLGIEAVQDILIDNNIAVLLCNKRSVQAIIDNIHRTPTLKTIIYTNDHIGPDDNVPLPSKSSIPDHIEVIEFMEFAEKGDTTKYPPVIPKRTTTAVIMYTSGSTGKPKGAVLSHGNVVSAMASAEHVSHDVSQPPVYGKEVHVSYLPLAHIFALVVDFAALFGGCAIGYADPKSLSTKFQALPLGALEFFKPTSFMAVPKIYDVLKKTAMLKVQSRPYISHVVFRYAYRARKFALQYGYDTPLFKLLVFRRFRNALGGRVRYAVSGGGPLNSDVHEFFRICFVCTFVQGYGLTETCAALSCQEEDDVRTGVVGCIAPAVEVKLESVPDFFDKNGNSYLDTDRTDVNGEVIYGRGEVLVRGPCVTCGYYMMPELTKEVIEPEEKGGWFHTGDIGQFLKDGSIKIIDRKKNLVKLKGGEYIALEQMEMIYNNSIFVNNIDGGICCYGDGDMDRPVALMQLNEAETMKWAKANGILDCDFATLMKSPELQDAVSRDMNTLHENSRGALSHLEKLVAIAFISEEWTPENNCLTAANKINRNFVRNKHRDIFDKLKQKGIFD